MDKSQESNQIQQTVMYEIKSWFDGKKIKLMSCPFCGGEPDLQHIGNDYTKKRKIKIKCKKCRCERTDAALRHGFDWLENVAIKNWNQRPRTQIKSVVIDSNNFNLIPLRLKCPKCESILTGGQLIKQENNKLITLCPKCKLKIFLKDELNHG